MEKVLYYSSMKLSNFYLFCAVDIRHPQIVHYYFIAPVCFYQQFITLFRTTAPIIHIMYFRSRTTLRVLNCATEL